MKAQGVQELSPWAPCLEVRKMSTIAKETAFAREAEGNQKRRES